MSPVADLFAPCSSISADLNAELYIAGTPTNRSTNLDGWDPDLDCDRFVKDGAVRSEAAGRRSLDDILAGLSPKNPLMPRGLTGALEFKHHQDEQQFSRQDAAQYDELMISARGDHEHVDEDLKKKYSPRRNACDLPALIWQWLKPSGMAV